MEPIVLVHGGAGDIPDSRVPLKIAGVKKAVTLGYKILKNGGSVLDAVEEAVKSMEDDEAFNAGREIPIKFKTIYWCPRYLTSPLIKLINQSGTHRTSGITAVTQLKK